jgi:hypothetical protein
MYVHVPLSGQRSGKLVERTMVGFLGSHSELKQSLSGGGFSNPWPIIRDPNSSQ